MYTQQPPTQSNSFDLRGSLVVLRRRKWTLILVTLGVFAIGTISSFQKTPVYQGTATMLLKAGGADSILSEQISSDPRRRVQNEAELVRSSRTRQEVQDRLGFSAGVVVSAGDESDVLEISARSTDPERAALIANTYAESHRDLRLADDLRSVRQAKAEIQLRLDEFETSLAQNGLQLANLNQQLDAAVDPVVIADINRQVTEAAQARESLLNDRQPYTDQFGQLQIQEGLATSRPPLEVLAPATVPSSPISPDHRQDMTVALVLGVLLGVVVTFVQEHLDDTIRDIEDMSDATNGLPALAVIPSFLGGDETAERTIVTASKPMSHTAEAYRSLRTSLEFLRLERPMDTIQVTSAQASEGKTTTVVNLAVAFAHAGERVAIIDCDLRRPRVHEYFSLDRHIGFTSILLHDKELGEVLRPAPGFDNLDVLCAGPLAPNPSELLGSEQFGAILKQLSIDHSIVMIDSPPVLPVTDARVLSRAADCTVVVCASGTSSKRRVKRSVESLRQVGAPLAGAVLSDAPHEVAYGYVDYGYVAYGPTTNPNVKRRRSIRPKNRATA